jgi:hypothetical protein
MKITIPEHAVSFTIPAFEIDIPDPVVSPPVVTPPIVTPPGIFWLYRNGVKTLAGDFTQQGTAVDYATGTFSSTAKWGLWLPYFAANYALPNFGYKSLLLSLKPTIPGQDWTIAFTRAGDIPTNIVKPISAYGPKPVMGVWADYVIPLADLGVDKDPALYKFGLQDQTGAVPNRWQFNNVGFAS